MRLSRETHAEEMAPIFLFPEELGLVLASFAVLLGPVMLVMAAELARQRRPRLVETPESPGTLPA